MKKIALILAVIMLFSAVSVFAAPSVEYIFYGVDDTEGGTREPAFFVFGKYTNNSTASGTLVSEDVGVYYNGVKYSYEKNGNTTNASGLFGIAFDDKDDVKDKMTSFKVQPYSVNNYGEKLGAEQEYDFVNDEMKASSNAKLASVSINRNQSYNVNLRTVMSPAFDPDTDEYIVYGYFGAANANLKDLTLTWTTEDPDAVVSDSKADFYKDVTDTGVSTYPKYDGTDEYKNKRVLTVTAPDGETSKTYTFYFHNNNAYKNGGTNTVNMQTYKGEELSDGIYSTPNTTFSKYVNAYPEKGSDKSRYVVMTFPIKDGMKDAKAISLDTGYLVLKNLTNIKNAVIATRAYDASQNDRLGKVCGKFIISDTDTFITENKYYNLNIDVTELVKDSIKANKTEVQIALQLMDLETNGGHSEPGFAFSYIGNTNGQEPRLSWSFN